MRKTVIGALIYKDKKLLMFQRPLDKLNPGLWEFVGGKAEKDETDKEALIRECKEEIGVLVEPEDLFYELDYDYPEIKIKLKIYWTKIVSGTINLKEHLDAKWIPIDELRNYHFCPADIPIIDFIETNGLE